MARKNDPAIVALLAEEYAYFSVSPQTGFLDIENTVTRLPPELREYAWEQALDAAKFMGIAAEECEGVLGRHKPIEEWRGRINDVCTDIIMIERY